MSSTITLRGQYGFAKLNDDVCLVQLDSSPAPRTYKVHVFRHDFVSVFPYSHTQLIACSDLLEVLEDSDGADGQRCWLEEDTATVFVAQCVMGQFVRLKDMLVPSMRMGASMRRRPSEVKQQRRVSRSQQESEIWSRM